MRRFYGLVCVMALLGCGDDATPSDETGTESSTGAPTTTASTSMSASTTTAPTTDPSTTTTPDTDTLTGSDTEATTGSESGPGTTSGSSSGSDSGSGSESSGGTTGEVLPDVSGDFLLAAALNINPATPLQWTVEVVFTSDDGGGGSMDLVLQPLALDVGSTTMPRTAFGAPLTYDDVIVDADGTFSLDLGVLQVAGATNPITGSDVTTTAEIEGTIVDIDNLCGDLTGMVTFPIALDLAGSTFAMIRITDPDPDSLPAVFPGGCR